MIVVIVKISTRYKILINSVRRKWTPVVTVQYIGTYTIIKTKNVYLLSKWEVYKCVLYTIR